MTNTAMFEVLGEDTVLLGQLKIKMLLSHEHPVADAAMESIESGLTS